MDASLDKLTSLEHSKCQSEPSRAAQELKTNTRTSSSYRNLEADLQPWPQLSMKIHSGSRTL